MNKFNKKTIIIVIIILGITGYTYYKKTIKKDNIILSNEIYAQTEKEEKHTIIIHITGEVVGPGIIEIEEGARIADIIKKAGGVTEKSDLSKVNLAYKVEDGQKIYIPNINDDNKEKYIMEDDNENIIQEDDNKKTLININTATQTELETLTGVGPSTALKIINYRKENGKFKNIEDLMSVGGIGESKFNAIKNKISVK